MFLLAAALLSQTGLLSTQWQINLAMLHLLHEIRTLPPLNPLELLGTRLRPVSDLNDPGLANLRQLALSAPEPRLTRALAYALLVKGNADEAERLLSHSENHDSLSLFALAFTYGQQGRVSAAWETLAQIPQSATYFAQAGWRQQEAHDYETAVLLLEKALLLDRDRRLNRSKLYRTISEDYYYQLGQWDKAVYWAQEWWQATPNDFDASSWLTALYLWRDQYENAYQILQHTETLGARGHPSFAGQMGRVYQARGDWNRAIEEYREAVVRNPNDPYSAWYLGYALYHQGLYSEAHPYLEFVARSDKADLQRYARDILSKMNRQSP